MGDRDTPRISKKIHGLFWERPDYKDQIFIVINLLIHIK